MLAWRICATVDASAYSSSINSVMIDEALSVGDRRFKRRSRRRLREIRDRVEDVPRALRLVEVAREDPGLQAECGAVHLVERFVETYRS